MLSFFKKPQPLRFEYIPRYYNPEKDEELKRRERFKRRLRIQRLTVSERKVKPIFWWVAITAMVLYLYLKLSGLI